MSRLLDRLRRRLKPAVAVISFCASVLAAGAGQPCHAASYTSLHDFKAYPQGSAPSGSLLHASDGKYYGTTQTGGRYGLGTIFRFDSSGNWTTLYSFAGNSDGASPNGALVQGSDGALYGTTVLGGGNSNGGTIFRFVPSTGSETILHSFYLVSDPLNPPVDVINPHSGLVVGSDGALYGAGGTVDGEAFRCTITGTYSLIHHFTSAEGTPAFAALYAGSDGYLYGMTENDGLSTGLGIIYKMAIDGSFTKLHDFAVSDGTKPLGALIEGADGTLWGSTRERGPDPNKSGTIFHIAKDGSAFSVVHAFTFQDGQGVSGPLLLGPDGKYYGCTQRGGTNNSQNGVVFSITPDGVYSVLHAFNGSDGSQPWCGLVAGGDGALYGTTQFGDENAGEVFKVTTGGTFTTVHSCPVGDGIRPYQDVVLAADGNYYGVTQFGGSSNSGTVFRLTPSGKLTILHNFTAAEAFNPTGLTIGPDGNLYGAAVWGTNGTAPVFRVTLSGKYTVLHAFFADYSGPLTLASDGNLYGVTSHAVYRMTTAGTVTTLVDVPDGLYINHLVQAGDGNLYGFAVGGGGAPHGLIECVTMAGAISTAFNFPSATAGSPSYYDFTLGPDGNLYGLSYANRSNGIIYRYNMTGTMDVVYNSQTGPWLLNGRIAVAKDGTIYGTAIDHSYNEMVYALSNTGTFSELASLPSESPADLSSYTMHVTADGVVYGVDTIGGPYGYGWVFTIRDVAPLAFTLSSTTVPGGNHITGVIKLVFPAPTGGEAVTVASNNAAVTVPPVVTVLAGSTSVNFLIATSAVDTDTPVNLTATSGGVSLTAGLTVKAPTFAGLVAAPNSVYGGTPCVLTVNLSGKAGPSGVTVGLSSSDGTTVPPGTTITVPSGAASATYTAHPAPVTADTPITFTAVQGATSKSATVTIKAAVLTGIVAPASVFGGTATTIKATLSSPAPSGGLTVTVISASAALSAGAGTITIPSGATSGSLTSTTIGVDSATPVLLTGEMGATTKMASVAVLPAVVSALSVPTSVKGGTTAKMAIYLKGLAGPSGVTISLSSSDGTMLSPGTTAAVPAGASYVLSAFTAPKVTANTAITITASADGAVKTRDIVVTP